MSLERTSTAMRLGADSRKAIDCALERDPDPITVYESLINAFLEVSKSEIESRDSVTILLEEATRQFIDNNSYKLDYRYLRLWMLYASLVENARVIFDLLSKKDIGSGNAAYYQEYATVLELANLYVYELFLFTQALELHPIVLLKPKKYTNSAFPKKHTPLSS
jgi:Mad3/BUB1 homology region 1